MCEISHASCREQLARKKRGAHAISLITIEITLCAMFVTEDEEDACFMFNSQILLNSYVLLWKHTYTILDSMCHIHVRKPFIYSH